MEILKNPVTLDELAKIAADTFGDMVKAVVDIDREIVAVDAELHSDLEGLLLANGSSPKNLWGINLYPGLAGDDFIEFDSMINMRPAQGNLSRSVDEERTRQKIIKIIAGWVQK